MRPAQRPEILFEQARRHPPGPEREAFLAGACGHDVALRAKLDALLAADAEASRFLAEPAPPSGAPDPGGRGTGERPGDTIGPYKLLQQIGEGGMGTVWMAEQREPIRRRVALKIIKLGMDTRQVIARFEAERQALAMMDHPHIAKVLDAGATASGRPYFAMELVRGVPLVEYCDTEKLDTRERLELFTSVCHAIQHAHQKGIIHRDIKPSNVLVTLHDGRPVPKVIDFGIAKATNAELTEKTLFTEHRQMVGTPAYMSPEQAEMSGLDVDTRSDVYSLGVLLYELLTGTLPFDIRALLESGYNEMLRAIREEEPHKPSTRVSSLGDSGTQAARKRHTDVQRLGVLLRGDLDWIVMRCLEKDRTHRYDSASGLADDIRRHLDDEPVTAGPPSAAYRLRKFVRRNRVGVLAGSAVAAVLLLGIVGTSLGLLWALDERDRADDAAERATVAARAEAEASRAAQASAQRASDEAERANAEARRAGEAAELARQETERATAEAERATAAEERAEARARELDLVVEFQSAQLLGLDLEAMGVSLRQALARAGGARADDAPLDLTAVDLADVNFVDLARGLMDEHLFERTEGAIDRQFAEQPEVHARLLHTLAHILRELGLLERGAEVQRRAHEVASAALGPDHRHTLATLQGLVVVLDELDRKEGLRELVEEGYARVRERYGEEDPLTLLYLIARADGDWMDEDPEGAVALLRQVVAARRRDLGEDHPDTLGAIQSLGLALRRVPDLEEAEACLRAVSRGYRRLSGPEDRETLSAEVTLARVLADQGRFAEALARLESTLEVLRVRMGDLHQDTLMTLRVLGDVRSEAGRPAEAEAPYRECLEGFAAVYGRDHETVRVTGQRLGTLLSDLGRPEEAEPVLRRVLAIWPADGRDPHGRVTVLHTLGGVLLDLGRPGEAEPVLGEAVACLAPLPPDPGDATVLLHVRLGQARLELGRPEEAEPPLREAVRLGRRDEGDTVATALGEGLLASLLADRGETDEALELLEVLAARLARHGGEAAGFASSVAARRMALLEQVGRPGEMLGVAVPYLAFLEAQGTEGVKELAGTLDHLLRVTLAEEEVRELDLLELVARESLALMEANHDPATPEGWPVHQAASRLGEVLLRKARAEGLSEAGLEEARERLEPAAEALLAVPKPVTAGSPPARAVERVVDLHGAWHALDPGAGHDARAAEWSERLARRLREDAREDASEDARATEDPAGAAGGR